MASESNEAAGLNISIVNEAQLSRCLHDAVDAVKRRDFRFAVELYSKVISAAGSSLTIHSNRSAALARLGEFDSALKDARRCKQLNPDWSKGYYREGVALRGLNRHGDALASFCAGLSRDPHSSSILQSLKETALESPLKDRFNPIIEQLIKLKLETNPFVITSAIGQELVKAGHYTAAVIALQAALRIGTQSAKLKGSVLSALATAFWGVGSVDKAIACMLQDLAIAKSLGDLAGEYRAFGNLGAAYYSKGSYKVALQYHRSQFTAVLKLKDLHQTIITLSHLGHVCSAVGDYASAISSHKQCVLLAKRAKDHLLEARETGNVGAAYLASDDTTKALQCYHEHLRLAKLVSDKVEEARAYSNIGSVHHCCRRYHEAMTFHSLVLKIARSLKDVSLEARAYSGLGHAARCSGDLIAARRCHEKQLDMALARRDRAAEGRACLNLGVVFQLLGEYDAALKLHRVCLEIARSGGDRVGQGRAYGNIGNVHSSLGQFEVAIRFHSQELAISREVCDRLAEASTYCNLAYAYRGLGLHDKATECHHLHLSMSRQLNDKSGETQAVMNLANHYCSLKEYPQATSYYKECVKLAENTGNNVTLAKAYHGLGYVHYCLGQFSEAIQYYEQDLLLSSYPSSPSSAALSTSRKQQNAHFLTTASSSSSLIPNTKRTASSVCRAYCNLGLAHKALGNLPKALDCQQQFLAAAGTNISERFCALGNIGDVMLAMMSQPSRTEGSERGGEALKLFEEQLKLARDVNDCMLEAVALENLGNANRQLLRLDAALTNHEEALNLFKALSDCSGECRSCSSIGNVYQLLGNHEQARHFYEQERDRYRDKHDLAGESHAYGKIAQTLISTGCYDKAIDAFQQQVALLEHSPLRDKIAESGKVYGNLADCYIALGEHSLAVQSLDLCIVRSVDFPDRQCEAYRCLGAVHQAAGNLQQALVCLEKRLVLAHSLNDATEARRAYGDLGCVHSLIGNYEQAVACLKKQYELARSNGDVTTEREALCTLGSVYQDMGEYTKALELHQVDFDTAMESGDKPRLCRACSNIGLSHESNGDYDEAVTFQRRHLTIAMEIKDESAMTLAYSCLGRVYHAMGRYPEAIEHLRAGLSLSRSTNRHKDEACILHHLGLSLWMEGSFELAREELEASIDLFESIRRDESAQAGNPCGKFFDLQTASYQALQRVLVVLDRTDDALVVAERARTRAFINLLMDRQQDWIKDSSEVVEPVTIDTILAVVNSQTSAILYYSLAAGCIYTWLLLPNHGIVKFHESAPLDLSALDRDDRDSRTSVRSFASISSTGIPFQCSNAAEEGESIRRSIYSRRSTGSLGSVCSNMSVIENYVNAARRSLGLDKCIHRSRSSSRKFTFTNPSPKYSDDDDDNNEDLDEFGKSSDHEIRPQRKTTLGLNIQSDRYGFLRMTSQSNAWWNCSSYSLGSRVSVATKEVNLHLYGSSQSLTSEPSVGREPIRGRGLENLYSLLIGPLEDALSSEAAASCLELIIVLQGDLCLVPFSLLRPPVSCSNSHSAKYLLDRFILSSTPSLCVQSLQSVTRPPANDHLSCCTGALVIGNPCIPPTTTEGWHRLPSSAETECRLVSQMLGCRALTGPSATRDCVQRELSRPSEVIHFVTPVAWKLSALVLTAQTGGHIRAFNSNNKMTKAGGTEVFESGSRVSKTFCNNEMGLGVDDKQSPSEFLLTAADILNIAPIRAKLIVLSTCHEVSMSGNGRLRQGGDKITSDGFTHMTQAFLAAGAQAVVVALWPVSEAASKMLIEQLYIGLILRGYTVAKALTAAQKSVRSSKGLAHPSNWAGWTIVGAGGLVISRHVAMLGPALGMLISGTAVTEFGGKCREAMRVVLHLVEKCLHRQQSGQNSPMYVTQESIEKRVGDVTGWIELMTAVGFRFEKSQSLEEKTAVVGQKMRSSTNVVLFPMSDPVGRLAHCSNSLQAMLGLSPTCLIALSKMTAATTEYENYQPIIRILSNWAGRSSAQQTNKSSSLSVPVSLWRLSGVHDFFASLGFDLLDVGNDAVIVRNGKNVSYRMMQYALYALSAVTDIASSRGLETANGQLQSLTSYSSSSMESLVSSVASSSQVSSAMTSPSIKSPLNQDGCQACHSYIINQPRSDDAIGAYDLVQQNIMSKYDSAGGFSKSKLATVISAPAGSHTCFSDDSQCRADLKRATNNNTKFHHSFAVNQPYSSTTSDSDDGSFCTADKASVNMALQKSCLSLALVGRSPQTNAAMNSFGYDCDTISTVHRTPRSRSAHRMSVTGRNQNGQDYELYDIGVGMEEEENLSDSGVHSTQKHSMTDNSDDPSSSLNNLPLAHCRSSYDTTSSIPAATERVPDVVPENIWLLNHSKYQGIISPSAATNSAGLLLSKSPNVAQKAKSPSPRVSIMLSPQSVGSNPSNKSVKIDWPACNPLVSSSDVISTRPLISPTSSGRDPSRDDKTIENHSLVERNHVISQNEIITNHNAASAEANATTDAVPMATQVEENSSLHAVSSPLPVILNNVVFNQSAAYPVYLKNQCTQPPIRNINFQKTPDCVPVECNMSGCEKRPSALHMLTRANNIRSPLSRGEQVIFGRTHGRPPFVSLSNDHRPLPPPETARHRIVNRKDHVLPARTAVAQIENCNSSHQLETGIKTSTTAPDLHSSRDLHRPSVPFKRDGKESCGVSHAQCLPKTSVMCAREDNDDQWDENRTRHRLQMAAQVMYRGRRITHSALPVTDQSLTGDHQKQGHPASQSLIQISSIYPGLHHSQQQQPTLVSDQALNDAACHKSVTFQTALSNAQQDCLQSNQVRRNSDRIVSMTVQSQNSPVGSKGNKLLRSNVPYDHYTEDKLHSSDINGFNI